MIVILAFIMMFGVIFATPIAAQSDDNKFPGDLFFPGEIFENVGNPAFSEDIARFQSMYVYEGIPYVAYADGESQKLTVMKFNGTAWENVGEPRFTEHATSHISMVVADGTGTPYVAFNDGAQGGKLTVAAYDGKEWSDIATGISKGAASEISLAVYKAIPYVAFKDQANDGKVTVMKKNAAWEYVGSEDGFSKDWVGQISLQIQEGTPYVAYADSTLGHKATVKRFMGTNWEDVGTPGFSGIVNSLSLQMDGSTPYLAYADANAGHGKAAVMKYNGSAWEYVGKRGFSQTDVHDISLSIYNGAPFVGYKDGVIAGGGGEGHATVMGYNGTEWVNVGNAAFSAGVINYSSLFISNGTAYLAYEDRSADPMTVGKTTVMKLVGKTTSTAPKVEVGPVSTGKWEDVGNPTFSADWARYQSMYVHNGTPYVAYADGDSERLTVMKYNGTTWESVGEPRFTETTSSHISITGADGTLYVAFNDGSQDGKLSIASYNGTVWTIIAEGISKSTAADISLVVDKGSYYVAFKDHHNDGKITVMRDGEYLGSSDGFSESWVENISLQVLNEMPYVAYGDSSQGHKATVKRFNGSTWVNVGTPGFSGIVNSLSLQMDGSTPYLAYADANTGHGKAAVMKYNESAWEYVGERGFSQTDVHHISLFVYDGIPFVGYKDGVPSGGGGEGHSTVMGYNGTEWVNVGNAAFSAGVTEYSSLFISDNTAYLAYEDRSANSMTTGKTTMMKFVGVTPLKVSFSDTKEHLYEQFIDEASTKKIINGNPDGTFAPDREVTRAEFATMLTRALGLEKSATSQNVFKDVPEKAWYRDAVMINYEYEFIKGYSDGSFRPEQNITREEAMVMISRVIDSADIIESGTVNTSSVLQPYTDGKQVSSWAQEAVAMAIQGDIIAGVNNQNIRPKDNITRGETATVIVRMLGRFN